MNIAFFNKYLPRNTNAHIHKPLQKSKCELHINPHMNNEGPFTDSHYTFLIEGRTSKGSDSKQFNLDVQMAQIYMMHFLV